MLLARASRTRALGMMHKGPRDHAQRTGVFRARHDAQRYFSLDTMPRGVVQQARSLGCPNQAQASETNASTGVLHIPQDFLLELPYIVQCSVCRIRPNWSQAHPRSLIENTREPGTAPVPINIHRSSNHKCPLAGDPSASVKRKTSRPHPKLRVNSAGRRRVRGGRG